MSSAAALPDYLVDHDGALELGAEGVDGLQVGSHTLARALEYHGVALIHHEAEPTHRRVW